MRNPALRLALKIEARRLKIAGYACQARLRGPEAPQGGLAKGDTESAQVAGPASEGKCGWYLFTASSAGAMDGQRING